MHRSETRELSLCADCGAEILPARDRGFSLGGDLALCMACAVRRGGAYDEEYDRWVRVPDTADLRRGES